MDVVVYRAKVQGGYTYNYSLCPEVDYEYLKESKNINEVEIITPYLPLYMGKFVLRMINQVINKTKFFSVIKDKLALNVLKKLNIEKTSVKLTEGKSIPNERCVEKVLTIIEKEVVKLEELEEKLSLKLTRKELYEILQILHLKKKIKINPLYCKKSKSKSCNICDKKCEDCFLGYSSNEILIYKNNYLPTKSNLNIKYNEENVSENIKMYVNNISDFLVSRKENLVIVSPPMLKKEMFSYKIVFDTLKRSGKVLYVTCEKDLCSIKNRFENVIEGAKIHVFNENKILEEHDMIICSCTNIPAFKDDFSICILDDRLAFLQRPYKNIFYVCKRALKTDGKFINITTVPLEYKDEFVKGSSEEIRIPPFNIWNPIPEPKFILSRYIGERTVYLPDISLDMLRWSLEEDSKAIIFTPSSRISVYLRNYLSKIEDIKGSIGVSSERSREDYFDFVNGKKNILISSNYLDALDSIYNINVIVMYSDLEVYTEDALLYMCSMANNHTKKSFREILFISNTESESMLKSKSIVRSINKVAWEDGYIKN